MYGVCGIFTSVTFTIQGDMKEITLRRSSSEKKLSKEKKKERKEKSKSVHFDGNGRKTVSLPSGFKN